MSTMSTMAAMEPDSHSIAAAAVTAAAKLLRVLRALDTSPRLTATEASALAVLVHGGAMNIGTLARHEQVRPPSMTRTIAKLEKRGLVERIPDRDDARGWIVRVTRPGRKQFVDGHERRIEPLRRWLDALDDRDCAALVRALPVIVAMGTLAPVER